MKVAFATKNLADVDTYFSHTKDFIIYEINSEGVFVESVSHITDKSLRDESNFCDAFIKRGDIDIVYAKEFGQINLSRLIQNKIFPIRTITNSPIAFEMEKLTKRIKKNPPKWIQKLINKKPVKKEVIFECPKF